MKNEYVAANLLAKDARNLSEEISKYNPGIDCDNKTSLATLAADAGTLIAAYGNLRQRLLDIHEEGQLNEVISNS